MDIQQFNTDSGKLFKIRGSLSGTLKSSIRLFETITIALENDSSKSIIIDIKEVTFIDSMSLGILVGILLKAKEKQVRVQFLQIPEHIKNIFETANLNRVFPDLY